jgi:hypothetical protein
MDSTRKGMTRIGLFGYFKFKGIDVEDTRVIRVVAIFYKNLMGVYVVKFHILIDLCFLLLFFLLRIGHGIIPRPSPRIATYDTLGGQIKTFERPMLFERLYRILRTGRRIPATGRRERRNNRPVEIDRQK